MLILAAAAPALAERFYVYQLPDGSRLITDRPRHAPTHRLISQGREAQGLGRHAAKRATRLPDTIYQWETIIEEMAARHNVDPALVKAVIHTESYFDYRATSHAGARGLMQLMPQTARRYGVTDIYDPEQNLRAGVEHLRYLLDKYPNKLAWALAAYNAGEQAVKRYAGIPPYEETRNYVKKVMAYHDFYRNSGGL